MPQLLLRGQPLGAVDAVLFDKDGTLSISEPALISLACSRIVLCLEQVASPLRPSLRDLLERAYGISRSADAIQPAGTMAVASRDHNLIATATALAQVGFGWPEALATSEAVFAQADHSDPRRSGSGSGSGSPRATNATTEGLIPWLEQLRSSGISCAVISNDDIAGIAHFLASHQLEDYFAASWSAEHRPRKPDPAAVHGLCTQLGVSAGRCALIGDANSDLRMAVAAGIPQQLALGFTAGWSSPPPLAEAHPLVHGWSELALG